MLNPGGQTERSKKSVPSCKPEDQLFSKWQGTTLTAGLQNQQDGAPGLDLIELTSGA